MAHRLISAFAALGLISILGCAGHASDSSSSHPTAAGSTDNDGNSSCTPNDTADASSSTTDAGRSPLDHRASACCAVPRAPGPGPEPYAKDVAAMGPNGPVCLTDSQCTAGKNGRCFPFGGTVGLGGCSYDECSSDSDCAAGSACACRASKPGYDANLCAPAGNCTVDADCGSGGYCSPSQSNCSGASSFFPDPSPYFCHTAADTCLDDADCTPATGTEPYPFRDVCAYDMGLAHWACSRMQCLAP